MNNIFFRLLLFFSPFTLFSADKKKNALLVKMHGCSCANRKVWITYFFVFYSFFRLLLFFPFFPLFRLLLLFPPFTLFSAFPPFTLFSAFPSFTLFSAFPLFRLLPFFPLFRFRFSVSAFYPYPVVCLCLHVVDIQISKKWKLFHARGRSVGVLHGFKLHAFPLCRYVWN